MEELNREREKADAGAAAIAQHLRFQLVLLQSVGDQSDPSAQSAESLGPEAAEEGGGVLDLRAETLEEKEKWISALQQVMAGSSTAPMMTSLLSSTNASPLQATAEE